MSLLRKRKVVVEEVEETEDEDVVGLVGQPLPTSLYGEHGRYTDHPDEYWD
jgi:hypothetical protein